MPAVPPSVADAGHAVEYSLIEEDYVACNTYVFDRNTRRWRFNLIRRVLLVLIALVAAVMVYARWETGDALVSLGDGWLVLVFVYLFGFPHLLRWMARRRFRSAAFAKMRAPMRMELLPHGLHSVTGFADALTPWTSIIDIEAPPAAVYLFVMSSSVHIVPRHAFPDETAFDNFVAAATAFWRAAGAANDL